MNTEFSRCLKILEKTQWLTQNEIIELQCKRLRSIINYAYTNVPYYHRIFRKHGLNPNDIKTKEDLIKLPILTKKDIRNNFKDLIARNFPKNEMIPSFTGGSTGEPLNFFTTKATRNWAVAAQYRAYSWAGYQLGEKMVIIWGSLPDVLMKKKLSSKISNLLNRYSFLNCHELDMKSLDLFVTKMNFFKPSYIRGYASAIYILARYIESQKIDFYPKAIITCAEKLFDYQRETIEKAFSCDIYDFYGSREITAMAAECSIHSGYHISSENIVMEFVKQGDPVSDSELGEILVTNLNNFGFPLIRYRNGDAGIPSYKVCECGRGLPLMNSIDGRVTDIIVKQNGGFVSTPVLTLIFNDKNIEKYQVIQEYVDDITVKLVITENLGQKEIDNIISKMKYYLGNEVAINIDIVDSIHLPTSGKRRVIISKVSHKYFE